MDFAPAYLVGRFFYRIVDFFHHWYVDGSRAIGHKFVNALEDVDETFAVKITLRYFFAPLYGDYSFIGRILGVIFRTGRIFIGAFIYLVITAVFLAFYIIWLAVPAALILYAAKII